MSYTVIISCISVTDVQIENPAEPDTRLYADKSGEVEMMGKYMPAHTNRQKESYYKEDYYEDVKGDVSNQVSHCSCKQRWEITADIN